MVLIRANEIAKLSTFLDDKAWLKDELEFIWHSSDRRRRLPGIKFGVLLTDVVRTQEIIGTLVLCNDISDWLFHLHTSAN